RGAHGPPGAVGLRVDAGETGKEQRGPGNILATRGSSSLFWLLRISPNNHQGFVRVAHLRSHSIFPVKGTSAGGRLPQPVGDTLSGRPVALVQPAPDEHPLA
ncbi:unnamed protein product, partial [Scytosiphon promiscuus]